MKWEVQTYTLCDGWINCWTVHEDDGRSYPETFPTRKAAQAALDEFFADIEEDIKAGNLQPGYDREEFRIVKVAS